jgi:hypothetical protein
LAALAAVLRSTAPVPSCAIVSSAKTLSPPKAPSPPPEIRFTGIVGLK